MSDASTQATQLRDDIPLRELDKKNRDLVLKAESAMEVRNWGYALTLLQAVVAKEPGFLEGRRRLRLAAIKENEGKRGLKMGGEGIKVMKLQSHLKKDPLKVIADLEREVLATDPLSASGNELLHEAAVALGLNATAGFALQTVIDGDPSNIKFYHKLGDFYLDRGFFDEAAKVFGMIVEKDRSDLEATKKYKDATARGSIASQKWDSGGDWRDLLKDKDQAKNLESEGRAAMTPEMLAAQAEALLAQYSADQNNLEVSKKLAQTYEQLEDFQTSLQFYEWALHLSNNDPSLEKKVASIRETVTKNYLEQLRKFVEENPDHPDIEQYRQQLADSEKNQMDTLIAESKERVDRNPTDNELRYELGSRLYKAGQYRDAIQHLQMAKRSPNLRIKVMNYLGQCYSNMGMNDLAIGQLEEAIGEITGIDDTKKELLYNVGLLYEKLGNKEKYLDALKQIYAADYGYKDVAQRVETSYGG